jgi:hypothetical protein
MAFTSTNQPANRGRKKGTKNKKGALSVELTTSAIKKLEEAVFLGEQWAITEVLKRTIPPLKAAVMEDSKECDLISAQTELTKLKAKEIFDFEARLIELERAAK